MSVHPDNALVRLVRAAEERELAQLPPVRRVPVGATARREYEAGNIKAALHHEWSEDIEEAVAGEADETPDGLDRKPRRKRHGR